VAGLRATYHLTMQTGPLHMCVCGGGGGGAEGGGMASVRSFDD
jgi:hypothetical protein